ncbi:MAG: protein-ADP-ribose hydrolase [Deltaproteobacteria bacterium]|nr:protein-ADP-ribose hydrolase [Deltaproteobacteria bacterium]
MKSTTFPAKLDQYRSFILLDEPFVAPEPAPEAKADRADLVDELLAFLKSEATVKPEFIDVEGIPSTCDEKRRMLRALLTVRGPDPLPSWFHMQLDRLLQRETLERGQIDASTLPRISEAFPESLYVAAGQCALWRGDITALCVDAIVNAANADMLGCFQPFHACIDNVIHSAAGPRLREDCHAVMQLQGCTEGTGWAKVTRAYNLPAKYILHTVGPISHEGNQSVSPEHEQQLADCYYSCLDLASRVSAIRSIAFCCISTGVFGFPREPAARIALRTTGQWLADNPDTLDLIIFNVFLQDDLEIYERILKGG